VVGVERVRTAGRSVGCIKLEYGMKSDWVGHGWARVRSGRGFGVGVQTHRLGEGVRDDLDPPFVAHADVDGGGRRVS